MINKINLFAWLFCTACGLVMIIVKPHDKWVSAAVLDLFLGLLNAITFIAPNIAEGNFKKPKPVRNISYKDHLMATNIFGGRKLDPITFLLWKYGIIRSYGEKMTSREKYGDLIETMLKRYEDNGYNPIHIFDDWYLIRNTSKNYSNISYYKLVDLLRRAEKADENNE